MSQEKTDAAFLQSKAESWQALLCKLSGVQAAQVFFSSQAQPTEIHILATTEKSSKSIARDVQSALSAQFGVEIDHHIISVAQMSPEMEAGMGFRLVHMGLDVKNAAGQIEAHVELSCANEIFTGQAVCPNTVYARRRCVANATLAAIDHIMKTCYFDLIGIDTVSLCGQEIVVVQLYCLRDHTRLVGSTYCGTDDDAAVVHSVLDALNRKLMALSA